MFLQGYLAHKKPFFMSEAPRLPSREAQEEVCVDLKGYLARKKQFLMSEVPLWGACW